MFRYSIALLILLTASVSVAQNWKRELAVIPGLVSTQPQPAVPAYETTAQFRGGWIVLGQPGDSAKQIFWETMRWGDEATNAVTRFDPSGKAVYMIRASKGNSYELTTLNVEPNGNTWIGGFVKKGSVTIGSANSTFRGATRSLFLLKVDSTGKSIKALQADSAEYSILRSCHLLPNGNMLFFGECGPTFSLAGHTRTARGKQNLFMFEMTTDGSVVRSHVLASSDTCSFSRIVKGSNDTWYALASYRTKMMIGNDTLSSAGISTVILKLRTNGDIVARRHATSGIYARDLVLNNERITALLATNQAKNVVIKLDQDTIVPRNGIAVAEVFLRLDSSLTLRSLARTSVGTGEIAPPVTRLIDGGPVSTSFVASSINTWGYLRYSGRQIDLPDESYTLIAYDIMGNLIDSCTLPGAAYGVSKSGDDNVILTSSGIYSRKGVVPSTFAVQPPLPVVCEDFYFTWDLNPTGIAFSDTNRFSIYLRMLNQEGWQQLTSLDPGIDTVRLSFGSKGRKDLMVVSTGPRGIMEIPVTVSVQGPPEIVQSSIGVHCHTTTVTIHPQYLNLIPPVRYRWSTGDTTESIQVEQTGKYSVTVYSGVCSSTKSVSVVYNRKPATPSLELRNDTLFAHTIDSGFRFTWFHNGENYAQTTEPFYRPELSGTWTVHTVRAINCYSEFSNSIDVDVTVGGVYTPQERSFTVAPNPFVDCIELKAVHTANYKIIDFLGVIQDEGVIGAGQSMICPSVAAGAYRLILDTGESLKIVKQ